MFLTTPDARPLRALIRRNVSRTISVFVLFSLLAVSMPAAPRDKELFNDRRRQFASLSVQLVARDNRDLRITSGGLIARDEYVILDSFLVTLPKNEIILRLKHFAVSIQKTDSAKGYVLFYTGRKDSKGASARTLKWFRDQLKAARIISPERVVFVEAGQRKIGEVEFYIVCPQAHDLPNQRVRPNKPASAAADSLTR